MSKLTGGKRLTIEDFSNDDQYIIKKLAFVLNPFMEQVLSAFQKNITINDNLAQELRTMTVEVDADGKITNTAIFKTTLGKITGLSVLRAREKDGTAFPTSAPFVSFVQQADKVTLQHVTGLPAATKFDITLWVITS